MANKAKTENRNAHRALVKAGLERLGAERPSIIVRNGVRVFLSIHDSVYLRERAFHKERLRKYHTDTTGGTESLAFRKAFKDYEDWKKREKKWYQEVGYDPPKNASRVKANLFKQVEKDLLIEALRACEGSKVAAADVLGISYVALFMKIKRAGITIPGSRVSFRRVYYRKEDSVASTIMKILEEAGAPITRDNLYNKFTGRSRDFIMKSVRGLEKEGLVFQFQRGPRKDWTIVASKFVSKGELPPCK